MATISLIAAMAKNRTIGVDGGLPWHLKKDLQYFKQQTLGKPMVMGRKTFQSFGEKPLPKRPHIIITRDKNYKPQGVDVCHSLESALELAAGMSDEVMVIGGGEIYDLGMEIADKIELTRVHGTFEADTFFPEIDEEKWKLVAEEFHPKDEKHDYAFTYLTYVRK